MRDRDGFLDFINAFITVSPTISNEERKRLLNRAVHHHGISIDEATEILNNSGLVIGEKENYFEVLGFSIEDLQNESESEIKSLVNAEHKKLYRTSLNAGGRVRPDGKTEEQWRNILNQARDTLIDSDKRNAHTAMLQDDVLALTEEIPDVIEDIPDEALSIPEPTVSLPTDLISEEHFPTPEPTSHLPSEQDGMILIPGGTFVMGSDDTEANDDEKPIHRVYVDAFYMDKYPVTDAEFREFIYANSQSRRPAKWYEWNDNQVSIDDHNYHVADYLRNLKMSIFPDYNSADHPVTWVSWYAAMAYAQWVGKRLPTEAEWEKAARGGLTGQKYPWGQLIDKSKANYNLIVNKTTSVGAYPPNDFGLYDMVGNVREWCLDKWDKEFYAEDQNINPIPDGNIMEVIDSFGNIKTSRVLRGGSWVSPPKNVRIAYRAGSPPFFTSMNIGFRCVRSVKTEMN